MVNNSSSGGNGSLIVPHGRCIMLEHVCALGKKSGIALLFSLGSFVKKKVFKTTLSIIKKIVSTNFVALNLSQ